MSTLIKRVAATVAAVALVLVIPAAVGTASAETTAAGVRALGQIVPLSGTEKVCPAQFTCTRWTVTVPDVAASVGVTIAVAPATAIGPEGNVTSVFLSGGNGTAWWNSAGTTAATATIDALRKAGQQVVQVRWHQPWLYSSPGEVVGPAVLGARPATVLRHIHDTIALGKRIEVTGNSGGAAQLGYALTFYGLDSIIAEAVFSSGPPHAAIDMGCARLPEESAYWYPVSSAGRVDGSYGFGTGGPCELHDESYRSRWVADSVEAGPDLSWPSTDVHFIMGARDNTGAPEHGLALASALPAGTYEVLVVDSMGHGIEESRAGLAVLSESLRDTPPEYA